MTLPANSPVPLHDVLIIGAGPCGLAVAARLREPTPSAMFTDDEHARYHWIRRHTQRLSLAKRKTSKMPSNKKCPQGPSPEAENGISLVVLDAEAADWMACWKRMFSVLRIEHLRSPMFFHVDPGERDSLLAWCYECGREEELVEIKGCVGREISKHRQKKMARQRQPISGPEIDWRDRKDYFTPSAGLFDEHCLRVMERYGLSKSSVKKERAVDIRYGNHPQVHPVEDTFRVKTDKGIHYARAVVVAAGPANAPCIPPELQSADDIPGNACHAMHIRGFPPARVAAKIAARKCTNIMVVGGGLTSAQLVDLALRHGVSKVWHIVRGELKVKPFDIDLEWMGKFRNLPQAMFYTEDNMSDRLQFIKQARNGGSVTPRYVKLLRQYESRGRVSIHTHTTLQSRIWNSSTHSWAITTSPPVAELPEMDYIYFATGIQTDVAKLSFLQSMHQDHPIPHVGGLPCINEDMMWTDDVPLYMTGRLGSLQLGPGGGNLAGARVGAERIAWSIQERMSDRGEGGGRGGGVELDDNVSRFRLGIGNRFGRLGEVGEESL